MKILEILGVTLFVLLSAYLIFRKVGGDYRRYGRLTATSIFLETFIFFLHGLASFAFLNSDYALVDKRSLLFFIVWGMIIVGLILTLLAMSYLGMRKALGRDIIGLEQSGFYRYTRNPQLVAYGLVVIGYALFWPSWTGLLWIGLYLALAHMMVRTEEVHLRKVFGEEYERWCQTTPRYIGIPRRNV